MSMTATLNFKLLTSKIKKIITVLACNSADKDVSRDTQVIWCVNKDISVAQTDRQTVWPRLNACLFTDAYTDESKL